MWFLLWCLRKIASGLLMVRPIEPGRNAYPTTCSDRADHAGTVHDVSGLKCVMRDCGATEACRQRRIRTKIRGFADDRSCWEGPRPGCQEATAFDDPKVVKARRNDR